LAVRASEIEDVTRIVSRHQLADEDYGHGEITVEEVMPVGDNPLSDKLEGGFIIDEMGSVLSLTTIDKTGKPIPPKTDDDKTTTDKTDEDKKTTEKTDGFYFGFSELDSTSPHKRTLVCVYRGNSKVEVIRARRAWTDTLDIKFKEDMYHGAWCRLSAAITAIDLELKESLKLCEV